MHNQLRRLALLVGSTSAIIFGLLAGYAQYQASSAQETVKIWYKNFNTTIAACEAYPRSSFCDDVHPAKKEFDDAVSFREQRSENAKIYLGIAVGIPLLSMFLFIGLRWVITGRPFPRRDETKNAG